MISNVTKGTSSDRPKMKRSVVINNDYLIRGDCNDNRREMLITARVSELPYLTDDVDTFRVALERTKNLQLALIPKLLLYPLSLLGDNEEYC